MKNKNPYFFLLYLRIIKSKKFIMSTISPDIKMADLIGSDYKILTILYRLGIKLGIGERSVKEVCEANNINVTSFILICNCYRNMHYIPQKSDLENASVELIVRYLKSSHSYYMNNNFKELEKNLRELVKPCEEKQKKIIMKFFNEYKGEVENHFNYEEDIVFPYIDSIIKGEKNNEYSIDIFEKNHSNIKEKLHDLKNIVMKYLPPVCSTVLAINVLALLFSLECDFEKHTMIENNILIPIVNKMERHG